MSGIDLGSQFNFTTTLPLDNRQQVADNTARDALAAGIRWEGMKVYVISGAKNYQLQGGILNANWVDISTTAALTTADTLTAFAGGGQASALALTAQINRVTVVATAGDSVKLPAATAGAQVMVINAAALNSMNIYPVTGEFIDSLAVNIPYALSVAARNVTFVCVTAGTWISKAGGGGVKTASNGITAFATGGQASATLLTSDINRVTTVASENDSVKLPVSAAGSEVVVINEGASTLMVYPNGTDAIDGLGASIGFALDTRRKTARFICAVAGTWRSVSSRDPQDNNYNYLDNGGGEDGPGTWTTFTSVQGFTTGNVNTGTDVITITGHGLSEGMRVQFTNSGGGLPAPLATSTDYYLKTVTANTFQVSATVGGAAVDITTVGSGVHGVRPGRPVALAGTSTAFVFDFIQSSPLEGSNSIYLSVTGNNMGDGGYKNFSIPRAAQGQVLNIFFDAIQISGTYSNGTLTTDSDLTYWIQDVTNGTFIQPSIYKVNSLSSANPSSYRAEFQTAYNSTNYRLILFAAYGGATYVLKLDSMMIKRNQYASTSPTSAMVDNGTITLQAVSGGLVKGAIVNDKVRSRQVGDHGHFHYEYKQSAGGTAGTGEYLISLPAGMSFDSNKVVFFTTATAGAGIWNTPAGYGTVAFSDTVNGQQAMGVVVPYDATRFRVAMTYNNGSSPNRGYWGSAVLAISGGAQAWSIDFMAPITGFSSSTNASGDNSSRVIAASYWVSANFAASTTIPVNFDSKEYDSHGAVTTSATAWKFTAPAPGYYTVGGFWGNAAGGQNIMLYKNGVAYKCMGYDNASMDSSFSSSVQLNAGDYIDLRPTIAATMAGGTLATAGVTNVHIERISGPNQIAASETIAASYYCSANKTGTSSTAWDFDTKIFDTHGAVTGNGSAAWKFTAPAPGLYEVLMNGNSGTASNDQVLLYKNGAAFMGGGNSISSGGIKYMGTVYLLAREYIELRPTVSIIASGGTLATATTSNIHIRRTGNIGA